MPQSPHRPSHIPRSQTSPEFSSSMQPSVIPQAAEKAMPLTLSNIPPEAKPVEICLSPSWSDHGERAKKKEKRRAEKEQKERERKFKQDEERQKTNEVKAGKRLSKRPPPAAMETQKMPNSLRRNSWISFMSSQSSSGENTRRSSRDEKRLSGMSLGSTKSKRSHSTPATNTESAAITTESSESWEPIVSSFAPKLPSFRWSSSRRNSSDRAKSPSSESDHSYEKDLIAFAYRLEASGLTTEPEKLDLPKKSRAETLPKPSADHLDLDNSNAEPSFKSVPYESVSSRRSPQRSPGGKTIIPESNVANGHDRLQAGQSSPGLATKYGLPSPRILAHSPKKSSHDGSSYVHKQRMYQQQQSIAGFVDQQTIKDATEAASELNAANDAPRKVASDRDRKSGPGIASEAAQPSEAATAHSKDTSGFVYTKQRDRSVSPHVKCASAKNQPAGPIPLSQNSKPLSKPLDEQIRASVQSAVKSVSSSEPQVPASSKSDRILGFRRRTKQPPALLSVPYNAENEIVAVRSAPLDVLPDEQPAVKRSKIERLFGEPKPAFSGRDRRSSSSSSRHRNKGVSLEAKPSQSHSRTRTASSTVLNDDIPSLLPKSATEPALNKSKNPITERASRSKSDHSDQARPHSTSQGTSQISDAKKPDAVPKSGSKSRPAHATNPPLKATAPAASAPGDDESDTKAGKKQAHEVIVESETGEGLIRKTSIKRPRSNPQLQTQTKAINSLAAIDFLPPLKHQPLVKRDRQSPTRAKPADSSPVSIAQFQEPVATLAYESPNPPDLKLLPRSPLRPPSQFPVPITNRFNRSSTEVGNASFGKGNLANGVDVKPVAKLFVICCKCKFWHDLPSKLYEAMALPLELHKADKGKVAGGRLETAVKCPWCEHAMTTSCCQGWTTVVYMHERHH